LKNVGVRELRDHATTYASESDLVAVSEHGQVIGFYIRGDVVSTGRAARSPLRNDGDPA
jgi:hypothetical protein